MKPLFILSLSAATAITSAAHAGPIDPTIGFSGEARIGIFDPSTGDQLDYFDLDMTARILLTPFFGIDLGYDGFSEFGGTLRDRYTAYFFYEYTEGQSIGVGYIPSPIDALTLDDRIGYGAVIERDLGGFLTEPFPHLIGFLEDEPPYGLLYDADYGAVWAGASVHINPDGDGEVYSVAATYSGSLASGLDYTVGGGVEHTDSETADELTRFFGLGSFEVDDFFGAISIAGGDSPIGSDRLTVVDASVGYTPDFRPLAGSVSSELTIGADYTHAQRSNGGSTLTVFGLGAEVTVEDQFGLGLSAGRRDTGGSSTTNWVSFEAFITF